MLALAASAAGCVSVSYVDRDNLRHRVGWMDVVVADDASRPIKVARVTVLGVAVGRDPMGGGGVTVGYRDDRLLALPDNACLDIQVSGACAQIAKPKGSAP